MGNRVRALCGDIGSVLAGNVAPGVALCNCAEAGDRCPPGEVSEKPTFQEVAAEFRVSDGRKRQTVVISAERLNGFSSTPSIPEAFVGRVALHTREDPGHNTDRREPQA